MFKRTKNYSLLSGGVKYGIEGNFTIRNATWFKRSECCKEVIHLLHTLFVCKKICITSSILPQPKKINSHTYIYIYLSVYTMAKMNTITWNSKSKLVSQIKRISSFIGNIRLLEGGRGGANPKFGNISVVYPIHK